MSPAEQSGNVTSVRGKNHLKLRIFHSFEEQEAAEIAYWASIGPEQRLMDMKRLMEQASALLYHDVEVKTVNKKVHIISYGR